MPVPVRPDENDPQPNTQNHDRNSENLFHSGSVPELSGESDLRILCGFVIEAPCRPGDEPDGDILHQLGLQVARHELDQVQGVGIRLF
jgi:hypothetical protein